MPTRIENDSPAKEVKGQESSSFLKKRTKKLLSVTGGSEFPHLSQAAGGKVKSFLFLFFKKEILPCLAGMPSSTRVVISPDQWTEEVIDKHATAKLAGA